MGKAVLQFRTSSAVAKPADETTLFMALFTGYVALLSLATVGQSGILKALANVFAVIIFGALIVIWASRFLMKARFDLLTAALLVYFVGIACSVLVNPKAIEWGDLIKIVMGPLFAVIGIAFENHRKVHLWQVTAVRVMFYLLALMPLLVLCVQLLQTGFDLLDLRGAAIFANRNNAALYAITLIGLYVVLAEKPLKSIVAFFVVGVMFGTLGVLLAVVAALTLTVAKPREVAFLTILLIFGAGGYLLFPEVPPFSRLTPVIDSVTYLIQGRINLYTVTFADLVLLLRTSDLSFMFRLKHWVDLWVIISASDAYHWLFGMGIGSSVRLSEMHLVPHNDYIRVAFEFGLLTFVGFIGTVGILLWRCGRRWETVPLLAVAIYFFSENLITNYTAMAFFFFAAGALSHRFNSRVQS